MSDFFPTPERQKQILALLTRQGRLSITEIIMGTRGLSLEHGLTNEYLQETLTDRAVLKIGREAIVVADHTKVNRVSTALLAPLKTMNTFVTDSKADKKFIQSIKKQGIKVVIA